MCPCCRLQNNFNFARSAKAHSHSVRKNWLVVWLHTLKLRISNRVDPYQTNSHHAYALLQIHCISSHFNLFLYHTIILILLQNSCLWLYSLLLERTFFLSFLILYIVGRNPWAGDQLVASSLLQTEQHKHVINAHRQGMEFEPTTLVFDLEKTVRALDSASTVIGTQNTVCRKIKIPPYASCHCSNPWQMQLATMADCCETAKCDRLLLSW
jgi:hypothetical protein